MWLERSRVEWRERERKREREGECVCVGGGGDGKQDMGVEENRSVALWATGRTLAYTLGGLGAMGGLYAREGWNLTQVFTETLCMFRVEATVEAGWLLGDR